MKQATGLAVAVVLGLAGSASASEGDCAFRNGSGEEVTGACTLTGPSGPGETAALTITGRPAVNVTFLDGAGFMWANTLRIDGQILRFDPAVGESNCWVAETGPAVLCVDGLGIH